jgi:hypothetical protein
VEGQGQGFDVNATLSVAAAVGSAVAAWGAAFYSGFHER